MLENRQKELTDPPDKQIDYSVQCIWLKCSDYNISETDVVVEVMDLMRLTWREVSVTLLSGV